MGIFMQSDCMKMPIMSSRDTLGKGTVVKILDNAIVLLKALMKLTLRSRGKKAIFQSLER